MNLSQSMRSGIVTAVVAAGALLALPAQAAQAVGTESPAAQRGDSVTIQSRGACLEELRRLGYEITGTRNGLCTAASLPFPGQGARIAACTAGMIATSVDSATAAIACLKATL